MKWLIRTCFLVALTFTAAPQSSAIVSLALKNSSPVSLDPGGRISLIIDVRNTGDSDLVLVTAAELPDSWSTVFSEAGLSLPAGGSDFTILSISCGEKSLAGEYIVSFTAVPEGIPDAGAVLRMPVTVREKPGLQLSITSTPRYVLAGEPYVVVFRLYNSGNVTINTLFSAKALNDAPFRLLYNEKNTVTLTPGEERNLSFEVTPQPDISSVLNHTFTLTVNDEGNTIAQSATAYVDVIPRVSRSENLFVTLPVEFYLGQIIEKETDWNYKPVIRIDAEGALDENSEHRIKLLLKKTADVLTGSYLESTGDQYTLNYFGRNVEVRLGDNGYVLSPLTNNYSFARGAAARYLDGKMTFGAFYNRALDGSDNQYAAAFFGYDFSGGYGADVNFRYRFDESFLVGLKQDYADLSFLHLMLEAAFGKAKEFPLDFAAALNGSGDLGWLEYHLQGLYFGKNYPYVLSDMVDFSGDITWSIDSIHAKLAGSYQYNRRNLANSHAQESAPLFSNFMLTGSIAFPVIGLSLSAYYMNTYKKETDALPDYNELDNAFNLEIQYKFGEKNILKAGALIQLQDNLLLKQLSIDQSYSAGIDLFFDSIIYTGAVLTYNHDTVPDLLSSDRITADILFTYSAHETTLDLLLHNLVAFDAEGVINDTIRYSLGITHIFAAGNTLSASFVHDISYNTVDWKNDFLIKFEYTQGFAFPLGKRKDIGALKGKVTDWETGEPLANVVLRTGNLSAVTDVNGNFQFPALREGKYYLFLDTASLPPQVISTITNDPVMQITGGKTVKLDIRVTKPGLLAGRVTGSERQEGVKDALVVLTGGTAPRYARTDENGMYSFEDILPGIYTVAVDAESLPQDSYMEIDRYELLISPGDRKEKVFTVEKRIRRIVIIEEGGVLDLTGSGE